MKSNLHNGRSAFTLTEVLVASALTALVMAGVLSTFVLVTRMWNSGAAQLSAAVKTDRAVNFILFGGPSVNWTGVRDISVTGATLTTSGGGDWVFNAGTNQLSYSASSKKITDVHGVAICDDMLNSTASLTNNGLRVLLSVYRTSASYQSTNTFTLFVRMRN